MPERVINIIHLDDELETVDWVVDSLQLHYTRAYPDWNEAIKRVDKDDSTTFTFCVPAQQHNVCIRYCICQTLEAFQAEVACLSDFSGLVVLDLMREDEEGNLELFGLEAYKVAKLKWKRDRIFMLTGFPNAARPKLPKDFPADQFIPKPPDVVELIQMLVNRLNVNEAPAKPQ